MNETFWHRRTGVSIVVPKESADEWHWDQWMWHKKRAKKTGWHRNQARWHAKRIGFSYLVVRTFRTNREALVANLTANNPLYARLVA